MMRRLIRDPMNAIGACAQLPSGLLLLGSGLQLQMAALQIGGLCFVVMGLQALGLILCPRPLHRLLAALRLPDPDQVATVLGTLGGGLLGLEAARCALVEAALPPDQRWAFGLLALSSLGPVSVAGLACIVDNLRIGWMVQTGLSPAQAQAQAAKAPALWLSMDQRVALNLIGGVGIAAAGLWLSLAPPSIGGLGLVLQMLVLRRSADTGAPTAPASP